MTSQTKRSCPPYFNATPPSQWNVLDYVRANDSKQSTYEAQARFHRRVIDGWTASLKNFADNADDGGRRDIALSLLAKYREKGSNSDKKKVYNWFHGKYGHTKKTGRTVKVFRAPVFSDRINPVNCGNSTIVNGGASEHSSSGTQVEDGLDEEPMSVGVVQAENSEHSSPESSSVHYGSVQSDVDYSISPPLSEYGNIVRRFRASHQAMCQKTKMRFVSTGRCVENIVAENALKLPSVHVVHSWVLPLDDHEVRSWFRPSELEELEARIPQLPLPCKLFVKSMRRFDNCKGFDDFRDVAENDPYRPAGQKYDRNEHFFASWVNYVVLSMLPLLETEALVTICKLSVPYYGTAPRSFLLDHVVHGFLPEVHILGKEIKSQATGSNFRYDAFIGSSDAFGIEVGAVGLSNVNSPEWVADGMELAEVLHSMVSRICDVVNHDELVLRKVETVGFLQDANHFQILRVMPLGRNMSMLRRGGIRRIPTSIDCLGEVFIAMQSIYLAVKLLDSCLSAVKSYLNGKYGWERLSEL